MHSHPTDHREVDISFTFFGMSVPSRSIPFGRTPVCTRVYVPS